jgi:thiazole synthase
MAAPTLLETLDTPFIIGEREFRSRLLVGTGKYASNAQMVAAIEASGAEVVTVAVRRVDLDRSKDEGILHHLDPQRYMLLANTAGCFTADDTIRYARLARAAGFNEWVKLEVIGDQETLLPDAAATIEATRVLAAEGFKVMAYTNDDLISALRLEDAGAVCVMPLASPTHSGESGRGLDFLRTLAAAVDVPVIGIGGVKPEHCAALRQAGAHGVAAIRGIWDAANAERAASDYLSAYDDAAGT